MGLFEIVDQKPFCTSRALAKFLHCSRNAAMFQLTEPGYKNKWSTGIPSNLYQAICAKHSHLQIGSSCYWFDKCWVVFSTYILLNMQRVPSMLIIVPHWLAFGMFLPHELWRFQYSCAYKLKKRWERLSRAMHKKRVMCHELTCLFWAHKVRIKSKMLHSSLPYLQGNFILKCFRGMCAMWQYMYGVNGIFSA